MASSHRNHQDSWQRQLQTVGSSCRNSGCRPADDGIGCQRIHLRTGQLQLHNHGDHQAGGCYRNKRSTGRWNRAMVQHPWLQYEWQRSGCRIGVRNPLSRVETERPFSGSPAQPASGPARLASRQNASGTGSTALGFGAQAQSLNSVAIGGAGGDRSTALSAANSTTASGAGAIAIGSNSIRGAQATASDSIAIGGAATAAGQGSMALGNGADAKYDNSVAIGAASKTADSLAALQGVAGYTPSRVLRSPVRRRLVKCLSGPAAANAGSPTSPQAALRRTLSMSASCRRRTASLSTSLTRRTATWPACPPV